MTGDFVANFTNPPHPSFSTYVDSLLDVISLLENKTVCGFPYVDSKQLEDANAIIDGFNNYYIINTARYIVEFKLKVIDITKFPTSSSPLFFKLFYKLQNLLLSGLK